nr:MAG TPA: hypothetical protein [Caudoviricetes sp.]
MKSSSDRQPFRRTVSTATPYQRLTVTNAGMK